MNNLDYTLDGLYLYDIYTNEVVVSLDDDLTLMPNDEAYFRRYCNDIEN